MSTPEEIAAALERDIAAAINKHSAENGSNTPDWIIAEYLVRCLGALDGAVTAREKWYGCEHSPAILRTANPSNSSNSSPEPATPAVGEDAGADCECTCASELAEKVRALLADVARLQKELDGTTFREERYAEDVVGARMALDDTKAYVAKLTDALAVEQKRVEDHRENALFWMNQAERKWATLAAVRKVAEDYHDVDVVGDPPREVACNPCANEILGVLEGSHEPRR